MKVSELAEHRRKLPEELTVKGTPGDWKKVARKEFNDIIKRFGATSKETYKFRTDGNVLRFDRYVTVPVAEANSMALNRDKRGRALVMAVAKWLVTQKKQGRRVSIAHWGMQDGNASVLQDDDLQKAFHLLLDISRIDSTIDWLKQIGERGENLPLKFDLHFGIELPKNE